MDVSLERLDALFTEYLETCNHAKEELFISDHEATEVFAGKFLAWLKDRLAPMTGQEVMDKYASGLYVEVVRLGSTMGFFVAEKHLEARAIGKQGKVLQWVPGHGGDVWAVRHNDGSVGVYMFDELHEIKREAVTS